MQDPDPNVPAVYVAREDGDGASVDNPKLFLHVSPLEGAELKFALAPHGDDGIPAPPWSGMYGAALKRDQVEHLHRQIGAWLKTAASEQPPSTLPAGTPGTWRWQRGR
jgi:hypothetical protein